MKVYLVGGAVRDGLLDLPIKDKDFVVVGATPMDLITRGFVQVGVNFPVFLHPQTHYEYALARTERKNGTGYLGFDVQTNGVSLKDDLARRDLTINAMARRVVGLFDDTTQGDIIDPFGGQDDLINRRLHHVSPAFCEDPLRVLRVARFYARFFDLGFELAVDTARLMKDIAETGELACLSRERVWAETNKALDEKNAFAYFELLFDLGILKNILPELSRIWRDANVRYATFSHLKKAYNRPLHVRFALLVSGLLCHQELLKKNQQRLIVPKFITQFCYLLLMCHQDLLDANNLCADKLLNLIQTTKAHKDDKVLFDLIDTVEIMMGKPIDRNLIKNAIVIYQSVTITDIDQTLRGKRIDDELTRLRLSKLRQFLMHRSPT